MNDVYMPECMRDGGAEDCTDCRVRDGKGPVEGLPGVQDYGLFLRRLLRANALADRLSIVGEALLSLAPIDGYLFSFLNETGASLICQGVRLPDEFAAVESAYRDFRFSLEEPEEAVRCFLAGETITVDAATVGACHPNTRTRFERWRMKSLVFLPIRAKGETVGVLMMFSQGKDLQAVQVRAVEAFLALVIGSLQNARQYSALCEGQADYARSGVEREQLIEFFKEAYGLRTMDRLCPPLLEKLLSYFGFDFLILLLVEGEIVRPCYFSAADGKTHAAVARIREGAPGYPLKMEAGALPIVILRKMTMNFADAGKVMSFPRSPIDNFWLDLIDREGLSPKTIVHIPVLAGQRAIGALSCYSASRIVELDKGQIRRFELLARFLGGAIENAKLYTRAEKLHERFSQMAVRDHLTGLYNFGYLREELDRRIHEYWRGVANHPSPWSIVILDIDHFKRFNDTYGHPAGNVALVEVSRRLMNLVRHMDVVCRYGGEEFVIILPLCDLSGAHQLAERIRVSMASSPLHVDEIPVQLTVSLGVAEYDGTESTARFIHRADRALYRAKQNGRNRVEADLPEKPESTG